MCPWSVIIQQSLTGGSNFEQTIPQSLTNSNNFKWAVEVRNATHSHEAPVNLAAIPAARILTEQQWQYVLDMSKSGASPHMILTSMKVSDPGCLATQQDIYNIKKKSRVEFLQGHTPLEALLDMLMEEHVHHAFERDTTGHILCLFIAPKVCVSTAHDFSTCSVLLMDSTYKTNQ